MRFLPTQAFLNLILKLLKNVVNYRTFVLFCVILLQKSQCIALFVSKCHSWVDNTMQDPRGCFVMEGVLMNNLNPYNCQHKSYMSLNKISHGYHVDPV